MMGKYPTVRQDPVVKALIMGLTQEKNSEFQTSALAVATLRNAGCIETPSKTTADPVSDSAKGQKEPKKQKSDKSAIDKQGTAPSVKMRGYSRTTDVLLEDAVFRGEFAKKDDHPIAKMLRDFRENPNEQVEIQRIKGEYKSVTYPNGKEGKILVNIPLDPTGYPETELEVVKIKDLDDIDLIATQAPVIGYEMYLKEGLLKTFSWAEEGKTYTVPEDPDTVWPSLKGTDTIGLIKGGNVTNKELLKSLNKEKFLRTRPAPTIMWHGWDKSMYTRYTVSLPVTDESPAQAASSGTSKLPVQTTTGA
jgi:hypothetical protein